MFNYPNKKSNFSQKINYANRGMQLESDINYANRGMQLESDINFANNYYLQNDIAVIHKKPIPIQIVEVDYPNRKNATIKKAFYRTPSTTDYNGIFKGKYIDFEAKETTSKTSFALNNIHEHQIKHMNSVVKHGGISFIIVRFKTIDKTFLLPYKKLEFFYNRALNGGRKSIKLDEFIEHSFELQFNYKIRLDYIEIIKQYESEFI